MSQTPTFSSNLLAWYRHNARAMPWRNTADLYSLLVAETMLQQTQVATVIPYYTRFLASFPTAQSLADAPTETLLAHWQGLGYYRRAHNLHKAAKALAAWQNGTTDRDGDSPKCVARSRRKSGSSESSSESLPLSSSGPQSEADLLALPGVGPYTAAVLAATAFNQPATVVDGNVERVMARLHRVTTPLPKAKKQLRELAHTYATQPDAKTYAREYANAIMELGATVCTPKNPACLTCPVNTFCQSFKNAEDATRYPVKTETKKIPTKTCTIHIVTDPHGNLYLRQRPSTGMLAGLHEFPHQGWEPTPFPTHLLSSTPYNPYNPHHPYPPSFTHTFSHFHLACTVIHTTTTTPHPKPHSFNPQNLPPLPTLMQKALKLKTK